MGIKSTYEIQRETAIRVVLSKVYTASDQELADMLEAFKESRYRNYKIVESFVNSKWNHKIEDVRDFDKDDNENN